LANLDGIGGFIDGHNFAVERQVTGFVPLLGFPFFRRRGLLVFVGRLDVQGGERSEGCHERESDNFFHKLLNDIDLVLFMVSVRTGTK